MGALDAVGVVVGARLGAAIETSDVSAAAAVDPEGAVAAGAEATVDAVAAEGSDDEENAARAAESCARNSIAETSVMCRTTAKASSKRVKRFASWFEMIIRLRRSAAPERRPL